MQLKLCKTANIRYTISLTLQNFAMRLIKLANLANVASYLAFLLNNYLFMFQQIANGHKWQNDVLRQRYDLSYSQLGSSRKVNVVTYCKKGSSCSFGNNYLRAK